MTGEKVVESSPWPLVPLHIVIRCPLECLKGSRGPGVCRGHEFAHFDRILNKPCSNGLLNSNILGNNLCLCAGILAERREVEDPVKDDEVSIDPGAVFIFYGDPLEQVAHEPEVIRRGGDLEIAEILDTRAEGGIHGFIEVG